MRYGLARVQVARQEFKALGEVAKVVTRRDPKTRRTYQEYWVLKDQTQGSDWPPDVIWDVPAESPDFPGVAGQNPMDWGYRVYDPLQSLGLDDLRIPGVKKADRLNHIEQVLRRAELGAQLGKRDKALVDYLTRHFGDEEYLSGLEAAQARWEVERENREVELGEKGPAPEGEATFDPAEFEPPPVEPSPPPGSSSPASAPARAAQYETTPAGAQGIIPGSVGGRTDVGVRTEGQLEGRLFEQEADAAARADAARQVTLEGPPVEAPMGEVRRFPDERERLERAIPELAKEIDADYEAGRDPATKEEALERMVRRHEELVDAEVDREIEPAEHELADVDIAGTPSVEQELALLYGDYLARQEGRPPRTSIAAADLPAAMRDALESHEGGWRPPLREGGRAGISDAEVLAAAKDAYEAYVGRRARLKAAPKGELERAKEWVARRREGGPPSRPYAGPLPPRSGVPASSSASGLPTWQQSPRGRWFSEVRRNVESLPEPERGRRLRALDAKEAAERRRYEERFRRPKLLMP